MQATSLAIHRESITLSPSGLAESRDEVLMLRFAEGDVAAFEEILRRHRQGVFRFSYHLLGSSEEAEDALQETFIRVIKSRVRYQATAKFTTWLYRIARNICIDFRRRKTYRNEHSLDGDEREEDCSSTLKELADPQTLGIAIPQRNALAGEVVVAISDLVAQLPAAQREVFLMRQELGLGFHEISRIVGCPKNTAKSRMRYALEFIRIRLLEKGITGEVFR